MQPAKRIREILQTTCTEVSSDEGPLHDHVLNSQPAEVLPIISHKCNSQSTPKAATTIPADPFFLEICAGSARVTTCLQQLGLKSSFGVDHKRSKDAGRLLVADLTTPEGQALCWQWVKSPNCVGIFCAPPCGTCSRARGIPVRLPSGKKIPGPKPLR